MLLKVQGHMSYNPTDTWKIPMKLLRTVSVWYSRPGRAPVSGCKHKQIRSITCPPRMRTEGWFSIGPSLSRVSSFCLKSRVVIGLSPFCRVRRPWWCCMHSLIPLVYSLVKYIHKPNHLWLIVEGARLLEQHMCLQEQMFSAAMEEECACVTEESCPVNFHGQMLIEKSWNSFT